MRPTLAVHILAGILALIFGFAALFAAKGAAVHRKSGRLLPLAAMLYWLRRVRFRLAVRGIARIGTPEAA